ncbi:hypothetical protein ATER59S_02792 [Aquamicrobium terrae]
MGYRFVTLQCGRRAVCGNPIDWQGRGREKAVPALFQRFSPMTLLLSPRVLPILMLIGSNVFMTFAWYGHLRFKASPIWIAVIGSWMIAFFEYWLAVPANRIGSQAYSAAELKTIQEVVTLSVFAVFSVFYLKEALTWNHAFGFALIAIGAAFIFRS